VWGRQGLNPRPTDYESYVLYILGGFLKKEQEQKSFTDKTEETKLL
jgi:hypothetical protein